MIIDHNLPAKGQHRAKLKDSLEKLLSKKEIGFPHLPFREESWDQIERHSKLLKEQYFSQFVVVGMGGSINGGKALTHGHSCYQNKIDFWDSMDPIFLKKKLSDTPMQDTHFVVISKSGETFETLEILNIILNELSTQGELDPKQFTIITEQSDSSLYRFARDQKTFFLEHPKDVGGRFSALSCVGLLPLSLIDSNFLKSKNSLQSFSSKKDLILDLASLILDSWQEGYWATYLWSYSENLRFFNPWAQQLWAESLAQAKDINGEKNIHRVSHLIPILGSQAQHSVLQQIVEGYQDRLVILIYSPEFGSSPTHEKMYLGLKSSLKQDKVPYIALESIAIPEAIYLFEMLIGTLGLYQNINPFIQPGVENAKKNVRALLATDSVSS